MRKSLKINDLALAPIGNRLAICICDKRRQAKTADMLSHIEDKTMADTSEKNLTTKDLGKKFGMKPVALRRILRAMPMYADGVHTNYRWSENDAAIAKIKAAIDKRAADKAAKAEAAKAELAAAKKA